MDENVVKVEHGGKLTLQKVLISFHCIIVSVDSCTQFKVIPPVVIIMRQECVNSIYVDIYYTCY